MSSGGSRRARIFRVLAYVAVFAMIICMGWGFAYARWRSIAIAKVRQSKGTIQFARVPDFVPKWLSMPEWLRWIDSVGLLTNNTTDDDLRHFAGFPLTTISPEQSFGTRSSPRLSDAGLRYLAGRSLQRVAFKGTEITGAGFVHLRGCSALYSASIEDSPFNDAGLAALSRIPSLKFVAVHGTQISDAGLAELKALPDLKSLDLSWTEVTDDGLRQLADLKLEALNLDCTHVTDAGLQHLTKLPLTELRICQTAVTPEGLRTLAGMKALEEVVVYMPVEELDDVRATGLKVRCQNYGAQVAQCSSWEDWHVKHPPAPAKGSMAEILGKDDREPHPTSK